MLIIFNSYSREATKIQKNKRTEVRTKKTQKQRRRDDVTAANDALGEAFSDVPLINSVEEI